jgi:hypothetical protein
MSRISSPWNAEDIANAGDGSRARQAKVKYEKLTKLSICSHAELSERWVQERIAEDPSILGLGDVVLKDKGKNPVRGWPAGSLAAGGRRQQTVRSRGPARQDG